MAFFNEEDDEEQQNPEVQGGGIQTSGATASIGGQGGAPGGAAPAQASVQKGPDKSGNFVGLNKYLNANKTQASKLGDQTAGIINNTADQARQSVGALNQAADQKIQGVNSLGADILGKIKSGPESLSQQERDQAKQVASAKYTGPQDATGLGEAYTNAQKATQTATQNINNSGTEQGRMGLISQVNAKPRTSGMNTFDNALLQAGGGRQKLAQASQANQDVLGSLDQASQGIQAKIGRADDPNTPENEAAGAIGQTNQAQADAYKSIQDALSGWKSGFTPKIQQAQNQLVNQQNAIQQDLVDDELYANSLAALGLAGGEKLYDLNLNDYLQMGSPSDINANNVASDEDYARYSALADLAGEKDLMLDKSKKSAISPVAFDKGKLSQDAAKRQAQLEQNLAGNDAWYNTEYQRLAQEAAGPFADRGYYEGKFAQLKAELENRKNEISRVANANRTVKAKG